MVKFGIAGSVSGVEAPIFGGSGGGIGWMTTREVQQVSSVQVQPGWLF